MQPGIEMPSAILNKIFQLEYNDKDLVRLGPNKDGGYVVNKSALDEADVLYTFGVGREFGFESDFLLSYPDKNVKMFDHTCDDPTAGLLSNCKFIKEPLKIEDEGNFNSLEIYLKKFKDLNKKIFLKVDVENYEYVFFRNIEKKEYLFQNITGMVFEFHELSNYLRFIEFISIICYLKNFFHITHIHGNNFANAININGEIIPETVEISFRSKNTNLIFTKKNKVKFPKSLDFPNYTKKEDIEFVI